MSASNLDRAFERSADAVATGERSVPDALTEWPDRAPELAPLLEAVALMAEAPRLPDAAVDERRYEELMARLRATPQEAAPRRWWMLSVTLPHTLGGWLLPTRVLALPAAAAAVIALALVLLNGGGERAEAATLEVVAGTVEQRAGGSWAALLTGAQVPEGARLRTSADADARLTFGDGSSLAIVGSAELTIDRHRDGGRVVAVTHTAGRLEHEAAPGAGPDEAYAVSTADATVATLGASFITQVDAAGTLVLVVEGEVTVRAGASSIVLGSGERARAWLQTISESDQSDAPAPADGASGLAESSAQLTIPAQFEAVLVGPDGSRVTLSGELEALEALGALAGVTVLPSATGELTLDLSGSQPGAYTLVLTRLAAGLAEVALTAGADETVVTLDASAERVELRLELAARPGGVTLNLLDSSQSTGGDEPTSRGVEPGPGTDGDSVVVEPPTGSTPDAPPEEPTPESGGEPGATPIPDPPLQPGDPALSSGVRGEVSIISSCLPLLGTTCPPMPDPVTLIVESATGVEVARLTAANGAGFELPLAPGDYRLRVATIEGQLLLTVASMAFSVATDAWTPLDLTVHIAP